MAKKKNKKNRQDDEEESAGKFIELLKSDRFKAAIGIMLLVAALYILLSEVSFLFTGDIDQSYLHQDESKIVAVNWGGGLGAHVSEWIINGLFGITSFVIPFILVILSLLLLGVKVESLRKCLIYPILLLLWLPIVTEMFCQVFGASDSFIHFGGKYGEMMHVLLWKYLGWGEIILMFALFVVFGFVAFGWNKIFDGKSISLGDLIPNRKPKEPNEEENDYNEDDDNNEQADDETNAIKAPDQVAAAENGQSETFDDNVFVVNTPEDEPQITDDTPVNKSETDVVGVDDKDIVIESREAEQEDVIDVRSGDSDDVIMIDDEKEYDPLDKLGPFDPKADLSDFKFPSPDLLKDFSNQSAGVSQEEQKANQLKIVQTLRNFNIGVKNIVETIGPTVTLFEIVPDDGVRVQKIRNLEKDIMLSLSATGIRMIVPMPGKGTIGIEVPNANPKIVGMRALIMSQKFRESNYELPVVMGRTITNGVFMFDLSKTPHLIVAGATGQGKSVGLNAIITSLLYTKHPSEVKFVLIDPKQLEFSMYKDIERHYLAKLSNADEAVITDSKKVVETLEAVCQEMENRYYLLSIAKVRNIQEYNKKFIERKLNPNYGHKYLPYIVVIVDEFGDLIATEGKKIETPIQRITQKARAAGIHMILATQRPSVNVITGVIKANCPTRIAFRVISKIDSMTILDCAGADQLIGRGDMLYSKGDVPERVQCAFVDTPEVEKIVEHIRSQQAYPEAYELPEPEAPESEDSGRKEFSIRHCDRLFNEVAEYVVTTQLGSTSNLQRKFEIGFNRAGKLMDQLEAAGIVGPARGSRPRDILIKNLDDLETLIASLQ